MKNILNRERGGLSERIPNLEEPSPTTTSCLKIEITCTRYNIIYIVYKMCAKLKETSLKCLSLLTSCWHINEKTYSLVGVNVSKLSQPKRETCSLRINNNKYHSLFKPQLLSQSPLLKKKATHEIKSTRVGLVITYVNMWTPLIDNTMSIWQHQNHKARDEKT